MGMTGLDRLWQPNMSRLMLYTEVPYLLPFAIYTVRVRGRETGHRRIVGPGFRTFSLHIRKPRRDWPET